MRRALFVLLAATFAPTAAHASGLAFPTRGVRGMAMGGAFVAGSDDPSAMWINPANLAALGGTRLMADTGIISTSATFARTGYSPVSNEAAPVVDPSVFVTTDFGTRQWTFAIGAFAPYGFNLRFPYEGPQRYSLISNVGTSILYTGVAVAWQPHRRFRVGLAFENAIVSARFAKAASAQHILGGVEDKEWDLLAQVKMTSSLNPTVGFGLWYSPVNRLELAFSLQTPISVSGDAELKMRPLLDNPNPTFDPTHQQGDQARLSFELPLIARGAVRYNHDGRWDVEAAVAFERWSTHRNISLQPREIYLLDYPGIDSYRIKDEVFVRNWKSTVAFSLGGSARVTDWLRVRGGYFYEPSAVPDSTLAVDALDADKHGIGLGATFTYRGWSFDVMYSHIFFLERVVTQSEVRQTNPIDAERTTIIGNGTYAAGHDIFGVAVGYAF
jgi:long-chain fatty acid transport protein